MKLYKTTHGIILEAGNKYFQINQDWDQLVNRSGLYHYLENLQVGSPEIQRFNEEDLIAPIGSQEVWAAGVTYLRSRDARMEESKTSGGADFYQKVYDADRPEIFFKAMPHKVVGHKQQVNIRKDSTWNVPEPELTLFINSRGEIQGYTVGNDMSSRSIEGENPLYLPQAKMYDKSAALGPCLWVPAQPISLETTISISILRAGKEVFGGAIQLNRMKRKFEKLAGFLYKSSTFSHGCFLMTGTGVVPDDSFTLERGDKIQISVENIGTLENTVGIG